MMNRYRRTTLITVILLYVLPVLCTAVLAADLGGFLPRLLYVLTAASIWGLVLSTMSKRKGLIVMGLTLPFVFLDLVHVLVWRHTATRIWFYSLFHADVRELWTVAVHYWWALAVVVLILMGYVYCIRHCDKYPLLPYRAQRYPIIIVSTVWLVLSVGLWRFSYDIPALAPFRAVEAVTPIGDIVHLSHMWRDSHIMPNGNASSDLVRTAGCSARDDEMVVLVLGSSARADHWQLYGYMRETTPHLSARRDDLICFDSCMAVAGSDALSLPLLMHGVAAQNRQRLYHSPALNFRFASSGYSTAWISNHYYANTYMSTLSNSCDYTYISPDAHSRGCYDYALLSPLHKWSGSESHKQFVVLHTLGSAFNYSERYPRDMINWAPDMISISPHRLGPTGGYAIKTLKDVAINAYDNSVLYTDYVLDALIRQLAATHRPVVMMYVADNGERLWSDNLFTFYRSDAVSQLCEYNIPLVVWASDEYRARYPQRLARLAGNTHKLFSSAHVYNTLLELGGVCTDAEAPASLLTDSLPADSEALYLDLNFRPQVINRTTD